MLLLHAADIALIKLGLEAYTDTSAIQDITGSSAAASAATAMGQSAASLLLSSSAGNMQTLRGKLQVLRVSLRNGEHAGL